MSKIFNNKNNLPTKNEGIKKEQNIIKKPLIEKSQFERMSQERILQKNVVYVIGLSYKLANKEILQKPEYFGQYGSISKVLTNKTKGLGPNSYYENCYSSYIYYNNPIEAALAILAVDNFKIESHYLKTSFGRTKYCSYFLRNLKCLNKDCFYLHKLADKDDIIIGDDSKMLFHEQHVTAIKIANLLDSNVEKKILVDDTKKNYEAVFPKPSAIFSKQVFIEYQNQINNNKGNSNSSININIFKENEELNDNSNKEKIKLSLNTILNGSKCEKIANCNNSNNNKIGNADKEDNVDNISNIYHNYSSKENSEIDENYNNYLNSESDCNLIEIKEYEIIENEKKKEPIKGLKLADILKNDKKENKDSLKKIKLADIINKKSTNEKKANFVKNEFNSNAKNINNKINSNINNKNITNNKANEREYSKQINSKSNTKELSNSNINESEVLYTSSSLDEFLSNNSHNCFNINVNDFTNSEKKNQKIKTVNNTLEENICIKTIQTENENKKNEEKALNDVDKKSSNSKNHNKQINSNLNSEKIYNLNDDELKMSSDLNKNSNQKPNNKNIEQNYFIDSGKSDPRSSLISSTSCSVSPNISYNQEIENHTICNQNTNQIQKGNKTTEKKRSFYTKRNISRFDFVLNNNLINSEDSASRKSSGEYKENEKSEAEIPEFVFDVLNKKISRFSFFKRFKNEYDEIPDLIFLENKFLEKTKDESWAEFIKKNLQS